MEFEYLGSGIGIDFGKGDSKTVVSLWGCLPAKRETEWTGQRGVPVC